MTKSKQVMTNREIGLVWMADILGRLFELWPRKTNLEPEPTIHSTGVSAESEDELSSYGTNLASGWRTKALFARNGASSVGRQSTEQC